MLVVDMLVLLYCCCSPGTLNNRIKKKEKYATRNVMGENIRINVEGMDTTLHERIAIRLHHI
ncbi:hypothetical protein BDC45DRAFT_523838 [Circinella umbellata]|nr:hypothetical protein BDC45DRAFT_524093 [Circinella umbellata]KAI7848236.1 hypothetical protein BDC45DRAFT_523838 [Circinella umbellata]